MITTTTALGHLHHILNTMQRKIFSLCLFVLSEKMRNSERMGTLWQRLMELVTPGTGFIMGEPPYQDHTC